MNAVWEGQTVGRWVLLPIAIALAALNLAPAAAYARDDAADQPQASPATRSVAAPAPPDVRAQQEIRYVTKINTRVPPVTYTVQGVYWPATAEFGWTGGTVAGWTTQFYGLDFRVDTQSHWGFHLNAVTGNPGSPTVLGTSSGVSLSGTDTIWSADIAYLWSVPSHTDAALINTLRVFAGYGDAKTTLNLGNLGGLRLGANSATMSLETTGVRVGFDVSAPLSSGSPWSVNFGGAYWPSVTTTGTALVPGVGASSVSVPGTGYDWTASIRYTTSARWNVEVGYRFIQERQNALTVAGVTLCPCHTQWSGPFGAIGMNF